MNIYKTFKKIVARILWRTRLCKIFKIKIQNHWIHFHPSALSAALWENPKGRDIDYNLISAILREGDSYIDVGSNIGSLAIHSSQIVGPLGQVLAVEPNRRIIKYLIDNCALNKCDNIVAIFCGCGSRRGSAKITIDGIKDDQGYLSVENAGSGIRVMPLDGLIGAGYKNIRLIKIDVEGFEEEVLNGAVETLEKTDFVLFEVCPHGYHRSGGSYERICKLLENKGFRVYDINRDGSISVLKADQKITLTKDLLAIKIGNESSLSVQTRY